MGTRVTAAMQQDKLGGEKAEKRSRRNPVRSTPETEEQQKLRFQIELEFVQCLANPNYLNFLAQRGYLKDPCFINYVKYLQYWKEAEYTRFLKYPMCLYFLDLLQYEHFRREIVSHQCTKFIDDQQILHWQHYTRKRTKLLLQSQASVEQLSNSNNGTNNNGTQGNSGAGNNNSVPQSMYNSGNPGGVMGVGQGPPAGSKS